MMGFGEEERVDKRLEERKRRLNSAGFEFIFAANFISWRRREKGRKILIFIFLVFLSLGIHCFDLRVS